MTKKTLKKKPQTTLKEVVLKRDRVCPGCGKMLKAGKKATFYRITGVVLNNNKKIIGYETNTGYACKDIKKCSSRIFG